MAINRRNGRQGINRKKIPEAKSVGTASHGKGICGDYTKVEKTDLY